MYTHVNTLMCLYNNIFLFFLQKNFFFLSKTHKIKKMYIIILNHIHGLSLPHKCKVTPHHYNIQYFSKTIIFEMEKKHTYIHTYLLLFFCIKIFIPHIVFGTRKKTFMPHPPSYHKKKSRLIFFLVCIFVLKMYLVQSLVKPKVYFTCILDAMK